MKLFHALVVGSEYWQKEYGLTRYDHVKLHLDLYLLCKNKGK